MFPCLIPSPPHSLHSHFPLPSFSQVDLTYQVEVQCGGFESSMADCSVTEVSSSRCSVFVTAGVACNTGEYVRTYICLPAWRYVHTWLWGKLGSCSKLDTSMSPLSLYVARVHITYCTFIHMLTWPNTDVAFCLK